MSCTAQDGESSSGGERAPSSIAPAQSVLSHLVGNPVVPVTPTNAGPGGSGTSERTNVVRHPRCSRCPRVIFVMLIRVLNAGGNTGRVNDRCAGARRKASLTPSDWLSALVSRRRSAPLSPAPSTRRPEPFSSYLLTTRFCHDYLDRSAANHDSDEASIPLRRVLGWRQQLRECRRASSSDQPAEKEAIPQALLLRACKFLGRRNGSAEVRVADSRTALSAADAR